MVIYNFAGEEERVCVRARESKNRQNAQKKCADLAGYRVENAAEEPVFSV